MMQAEIENWFRSKNWKPFSFQYEVWEKYAEGYSGLLNAPTGSGKTLALWMPALMEWKQQNKKQPSLQLLWITPLKALAKDLHRALSQVSAELNTGFKVELRTGDVSSAKKKKQLEKLPHALITTPESLHLMLSMGNSEKIFGNLQTIVVDEWHELFGSKRGVLVELALAHIRSFRPLLKTWGISATIGNLDQSLDVLLGMNFEGQKCKVVADILKPLEIHSILPDEIEKFPWAGHLGVKLISKLEPIIEGSKSTLLFTNTRGQAEIWYQQLLIHFPHLAGTIAIHHGSLSQEVRTWVEKNIHNEKLKLVVCTSSLDLGVDFSPVETVIQIGSPKGVARFLQRAGRSGHQPDALSNIYFVPTHSLELIEGAALKDAIAHKILEDRIPVLKPIDVLVQFLVTLAVGDGFHEEKIFEQVQSAFAFHDLSRQEWEWCLQFITTGGESLQQYDEFSKVDFADGLFKVHDKKIALRHRLSIGTIVAETSMFVRYVTGGTIGTIEEYFITQMNPGDVFWFAGRCLSLVRVRNDVAYVRRVKPQKARVPSWLGGRMPLSSQLSAMIRQKIHEAKLHEEREIEVKALKPLFDLQEQRSALPSLQEFLIEKIETDEGCHCFFFPFEGRLVHEGMAALLAHRISKIKPITFSIAMNDYGFELLSDSDIPLEAAIYHNLFTAENLLADIQRSVNSTEMAMRRFREVSRIAGLIFQGYPGQSKKERHLQSSVQLLFKVFSEYDKTNLLLKQCYQEVLDYQLEELRLRTALMRINSQNILVKYPPKPTPFAFPIMVDRMREKLSSEKLEDRVKRMQLKFAEAPDRKKRKLISNHD